ncbi:MAG: hypothetical protein IJY15_12070 [Thermoguttaceae bacterium]|nr:hypothetical protein [Thermoguttaceae bacterium]
MELPCKATVKVGADAVARAARVVRWCWDSFDQCFRIARKESLNPFEQRTGPVAPERRTLDVIRDAGANGLTAAEITRKISMFNQKNGKKKRAKILNALVDQGLIEQFVDRSGKRAVQKFRTVELVEAEETTEDDEE